MESGKARLKRLDAEFERMEGGRTPVDAEDRAEVLGRLASTEKRQAEIEFHCRIKGGAHSDRWRETLRKSCAYYHRAFCLARSQTWALAQEVALTLALDGSSAALPSQPIPQYHALASQLLDLDRRENDRLRRLWALGNLIELELASLWLVERFDEGALDEAAGKARERTETLAEEFQAAVGRHDWELVSHRRQLIRYLDWLYCNPEQNEASRAGAIEVQTWDRHVRKKICELCESLFSRLPPHG